MMVEAAQQPQEQQEREWTWLYPWRFLSSDDLRDSGLEQYTAFTDGIMVGRYGELVGSEHDIEAWQCSLRKRKEIDRCLVELDRVGQRRLLMAYYCKGLSLSHRGWADAARLVRVQGVQPPKRCPGPVRCRVAGDDRFHMPACEVGRHCQWSHDTFEVQLTLAIQSLWRAHDGRYQ